MIQITLSDAEAYAVSEIIRDFISENNVEKVAYGQLKEIRTMLYNHALNRLTYTDMANIDSQLYKGDN